MAPGERMAVAGAGGLVVASLLPWYRVGLFGRPPLGWDPPAGGAVALAVLLAVGMAGEVLWRRSGRGSLPRPLLARLGVPGVGRLQFVAGLGCVGLVLFKVAFESRDSAVGMWLGVAAAATVAYGGYLMDLYGVGGQPDGRSDAGSQQRATRPSPGAGWSADRGDRGDRRTAGADGPGGPDRGAPPDEGEAAG